MYGRKNKSTTATLNSDPVDMHRPLNLLRPLAGAILDMLTASGCCGPNYLGPGPGPDPIHALLHPEVVCSLKTTDSFPASSNRFDRIFKDPHFSQMNLLGRKPVTVHCHRLTAGHTQPFWLPPHRFYCLRTSLTPGFTSTTPIISDG